MAFNLQQFCVFSAALVCACVFTTCKRGPIGDGPFACPPKGPIEINDTFVMPNSGYFFYGSFEGNFFLWQDSMPSDWDRPSLKQTNEQSSGNIYYDYCGNQIVNSCNLDSTEALFELSTRFIRPNDPSMRLSVSFYACGAGDSMAVLEAVQLGANPFSNVQFSREGVEVVFIDESNEAWTTQAGSGQPEGAYFRVTDCYPMTPSSNVEMHVVEGEFSGRLFNNDREIIVREAKIRAKLI